MKNTYPKQKRNLFFVLLLVFACKLSMVNGQVSDSIARDSILVPESESIEKIMCVADGRGKEIVLRWAPATPAMWQAGNRYGYKIERLSIVQNGVFNENAENEKIVLVDAFKPLAMEAWAPLIAKNEYAEVVNELIYGEQENKESTDFLSAMKRYNELSLRFGFALFVCDMYPDVAQAAALSWTDTDIKAGNRYIYRVSLAQVPEGLPAESGATIVSTNEAFRLPLILQFEARGKNEKADLSWHIPTHKGLYTAYKVERSTDGKNFKPVSDLPFSPMSEEEEPEYAFFSDSIPQNGVTYYYRVAGITPFATTGPYSEVRSIIGSADFDRMVRIDTVYEVGNDIHLTWSTEGEALLNRFEIYRAFKHDGPYEKLQTGTISPHQLSWVDKNVAGNSVYYRMEAIGQQANQSAFSNPYSLFRVDTIPPLPPTGLEGKADKQGKVVLKWEQNSEPDFYGYRIFRANSEEEEFTEITSSILQENNYQDSIYLKTTTPAVFYKLVALDKHYNTSDYSATLRLARPDTIPPIPPVITRAGINENGLYMYWEYSTSEDIAYYELYRICIDSATQVLEDKWENNPLRTYFADPNLTPGNSYAFMLTATDYSGNTATSRTGDYFYETGIRPAIKDIKAEVNRETKKISLTWNYQFSDQVERYYIYRSVGDEPLVLFETILAHQGASFEDTLLNPGNAYKYKIKALFKNGLESQLSDRKEVKY